jgi:hypothetical protein
MVLGRLQHTEFEDDTRFRHLPFGVIIDGLRPDGSQRRPEVSGQRSMQPANIQMEPTLWVR